MKHINRPKGNSGHGSGFDSLDAVVTDYIEQRRSRAERELRYFSIQKTLEQAIVRGALAAGPSGKRLAHQRRIPAEVLRKSAARLHRRAAAFRRAKNFDELFAMVEAAIGRIHGIGTLTVYDTALRIGPFLKLEPAKVFLHAGTRDGARALRLNHAKPFIEMSELPAVFGQLKPREIEDCLCIYKDELKRLGNAR